MEKFRRKIGFWCELLEVYVLLVHVRQIDVKNCRNTKNGKDYTGTVAISKTGRKCQAWASNEPQSRNEFTNSTEFPDGSAAAAKNYCRNPMTNANSKNNPYVDGVWCFTTDPTIERDMCDIPMCGRDSIDLVSHYQGCYWEAIDGRQRDLPVGPYTARYLNPETCILHCAEGNYTFAGVQDGTECWCGNNEDHIYGPAPEDGRCDRRCATFAAYICGSYGFNSMYRVVDTSIKRITQDPTPFEAVQASAPYESPWGAPYVAAGGGEANEASGGGANDASGGRGGASDASGGDVNQVSGGEGPDDAGVGVTDNASVGGVNATTDATPPNHGVDKLFLIVAVVVIVSTVVTAIKTFSKPKPAKEDE